MNKREAIHALVDKLLDIEETRKRGINFSYCSVLGIDFYCLSTPESYSDFISERNGCYFSPKYCESIDDDLKRAFADVEAVNAIPDREPVVKVEMTESKAKGLGLIA